MTTMTATTTRADAPVVPAISVRVGALRAALAAVARVNPPSTSKDRPPDIDRPARLGDWVGLVRLDLGPEAAEVTAILPAARHLTLTAMAPSRCHGLVVTIAAQPPSTDQLGLEPASAGGLVIPARLLAGTLEGIADDAVADLSIESGVAPKLIAVIGRSDRRPSRRPSRSAIDGLESDLYPALAPDGQGDPMAVTAGDLHEALRAALVCASTIDPSVVLSWSPASDGATAGELVAVTSTDRYRAAWWGADLALAGHHARLTTKGASALAELAGGLEAETEVQVLVGPRLTATAITRDAVTALTLLQTANTGLPEPPAIVSAMTRALAAGIEVSTSAALLTAALKSARSVAEPDLVGLWVATAGPDTAGATEAGRALLLVEGADRVSGHEASQEIEASAPALVGEIQTRLSGSYLARSLGLIPNQHAAALSLAAPPVGVVVAPAAGASRRPWRHVIAPLVMIGGEERQP